MFLLSIFEYYYIVKKNTRRKYFFIVFWQMYYSFVVVGFLLLLLIKQNIEWINVAVIIFGSLVIHAHPYLFILLSEKSWKKYTVFSFMTFSLVLLTIAPDVLKKPSIKFSRIGDIHYKTIVVDEKECTYLNKYFTKQPCRNNQIENLKGLWLQGEIYLFEDENLTRYKIHKNSIIREEI